MAPEQEHGGIATPATDAWGIAAVLRWAGLELPDGRPSVAELARRLEQ
jgi:hypothetical protein